MIEIIPAIMPQSFQDLRENTESVSDFVSTVQIDIMDGIFVPEKTWPYGEGDSTLMSLIQDGYGLPNSDEVEYEIDLMVADPEAVIPDWIGLCASRIIIHIESLEDPKLVIPMIRTYMEAERGVGDCTKHLELGIALNNDTPLESLYPIIQYVDFIQLMGIARIGYQGEAFDEKVIPRIESLRALSEDVIISIDGSVNFDTAERLVATGANRLVSGSAILKSDNIAQAIEKLQTIANTSSHNT